ncbi:MAG: GtrA family protein [Candidatus Izemoplasmatales bacterium]
MKKLYEFIKKNFLTKKFLSFGIIGLINTLIHLLVYSLSYNHIFSTVSQPWLLAFLSNTLAFITASTFSYFANAVFTFKPANKSALQFSAVMGVFLARLLISNLLTTGFDYAIQEWMGIDYALHQWAETIAPFMGSLLLIPIAFFALDVVFKKTDKKKSENPSA